MSIMENNISKTFAERMIHLICMLIFNYWQNGENCYDCDSNSMPSKFILKRNIHEMGD